MKKSFKILAVVLALVLVGTVFAACGKKAEKEPESKTPVAQNEKGVKVIDINLTDEVYAFGVDKAQPELLEKVNAFIDKIMADGTFDKICNNYFGDGTPVEVVSAAEDSSKDQLVVATNAEFEPFEYKSGDKFVGIDMEIAALLAKELNKELVIKHMDFNAVCLSVGQHKCDIAMAGLTVQEDRKEHVEFTKSYYKASQRIIVSKTDTTFDSCKTADDVLAILKTMDDKTVIGYQNGTTGAQYTSNKGNYEGNALKVTGKGYRNGSLAVQDLVNGNIKYVIIDQAPAESIVKAINANIA